MLSGWMQTFSEAYSFALVPSHKNVIISFSKGHTFRPTQARRWNKHHSQVSPLLDIDRGKAGPSSPGSISPEYKKAVFAPQMPDSLLYCESTDGVESVYKHKGLESLGLGASF